METSLWFRFVLCVLGVWRVTHLLAAEDGPWDIVVRLRRALGNTILGKLMDCFYCLSLWISVPFAFFVGGGARVSDWLIVWLALSGGACLLHRTEREPVVFESLDNPRVQTGAEGEKR